VQWPLSTFFDRFRWLETYFLLQRLVAIITLLYWELFRGIHFLNTFSTSWLKRLFTKPDFIVISWCNWTVFIQMHCVWTRNSTPAKKWSRPTANLCAAWNLIVVSSSTLWVDKSAKERPLDDLEGKYQRNLAKNAHSKKGLNFSESSQFVIHYNLLVTEYGFHNWAIDILINKSPVFIISDA